MWSIVTVTGWLIVSGIMDVRTRRIPIWMLALGGVLAAWAVCCQDRGYLEAMGGLLPGALLLLLAYATKKAGYGDGIVLCCLGIVLEGGKSLLLLGVSLFLAALFALALLAMRRAGRNSSLPFVPFLAAAWLIVVFL